MSYDELELNLVGDRKTALFVIISETDDTFNFIVSIMYTQLFNLLCEGKQELVSDSIPAGGCYSFQNVTDKEYTVGIHAEVDENTDIKAFVYDGKDTEPYTR